MITRHYYLVPETLKSVFYTDQGLFGFDFFVFQFKIPVVFRLSPLFFFFLIFHKVPVSVPAPNILKVHWAVANKNFAYNVFEFFFFTSENRIKFEHLLGSLFRRVKYALFVFFFSWFFRNGSFRSQNLIAVTIPFWNLMNIIINNILLRIKNPKN